MVSSPCSNTHLEVLNLYGFQDVELSSVCSRLMKVNMPSCERWVRYTCKAAIRFWDRRDRCFCKTHDTFAVVGRKPVPLINLN